MKKEEHLPQDTFCKETLYENTHPPFLAKRIAWLMSPGLGLGSYCLDATYQGKWYTVDATLTLRDPGRFINHTSSHCNLKRCQTAS